MSVQEILTRVASGELSPSDAASLMPGKSPAKVTMKVSEKGGLSVYGLGRWPVTLYRGQWETLLEQAGAIKSFIAANTAALSVKE